MDMKGISLYLAVTFGLMYAAVAVLMGLGMLALGEENLFKDLLLVALMWIPAIGGLVAAKLAPHPDYDRGRIWPLPMKPTLVVAVGVPLVFLSMTVLVALVGWSDVQWSLPGVQSQLNTMMQQPLPEQVAAIAPAIALVGITLLSMLLGATIFAGLALGSELGWRGYLLPRLMPLGPWAAFALSALLWFLWGLPLVFAAYYGAERLGDVWGFLPRLAAMAFLLSVILGTIRLRHEHTGLAAVFLGCFFAQAEQGVWQYLAPIMAEPWTGAYGVVSIALWAVAAAVVVVWGKRPRASAAENETQMTQPE